MALTEENYISLTSAELDTCKHIGDEYFCEAVFLVKHKTSQSCESKLFFDLFPDVIDNNCDNIFSLNVTPKAVIVDAGDTLFLSYSDKAWYPHCNQHNSVPIPIPAYDYRVINGSHIM